MRTFISFQEARETVLGSAFELDSEHVRLTEARGRTLSAEVVSTQDIPPFDNSAMDGFAVRFKDCAHIPTVLEIVGEAPAGRPFEGVVGPGQAARIMTGAPLPGGADTVVQVEHTSETPEGVRIEQATRSGANVREAGKDVSAGMRVLEAGSAITPPVVGMLATLGVVNVPVARRPRVAVISTGDEIVPPDTDPGPGQIRNSNGPALAAQVVSAGGVAAAHAHAPDDPGAMRGVIDSVGGVDLMLFSGGVSMGKYDYVRTELERMGTEWMFWKVRQRPGKPLIFGRMNNTLILGLPGNPVSSAVCFEIYARPLLARMLGRRNAVRATEPARLGRSLSKVSGLHYFARGVSRASESGTVVVDTGPQGSNIYSSMVLANCLIHLSEDLENPGEGTPVDIERLDW